MSSIKQRFQPRSRGLDPIRDHVRIVYFLTWFEFPWDMARALEFALFRTFASPRIARLLDATGEFRQRGQKRYDDTAILIAEMMLWGYDSRRGRAAIARMNAIHSRFRIANEDYLYVLAAFVLDPIRWIDAYGRRPLLDNERRGLFYFFRAVGQRMDLRDLPDTLEAMEQFARDYERRYMAYTPSNRRVADATVRIVQGWVVPGTRWLVQPAVRALMDSALRGAFAYYAPPKLWTRTVRAALKARARLLRVVPPRQRAYFIDAPPPRTYPDGYAIDSLGPPERASSVPGR